VEKVVVITGSASGNYGGHKDARIASKSDLAYKVSLWLEENPGYIIVGKKTLKSPSSYSDYIYSAQTMIEIKVKKRAESSYDKLIEQYGESEIIDQIIFLLEATKKNGSWLWKLLF